MKNPLETTAQDALELGKIDVLMDTPLVIPVLVLLDSPPSPESLENGWLLLVVFPHSRTL